MWDKSDMDYRARIRAKIKERGFSMESLSLKMGTNPKLVGDIIRKNAKVAWPRYDTAKAIADHLGTTVEWIFEGVLPPVESIPLGGYVGAGAEVLLATESDEDFGRVDISVPGNAQAIIVRGESQQPLYKDGDILIYWNKASDPTPLMRQMCAVRVDDGRTLVKTLTPSQSDGCFDLTSYNAVTIADVRVEWAAKIEHVIFS